MPVEREVAGEERRSRRERKAQQRISARYAIGRARIAHEVWMEERSGHATRRKISRGGRKALARQSALRLRI